MLVHRPLSSCHPPRPDFLQKKKEPVGGGGEAMVIKESGCKQGLGFGALGPRDPLLLRESGPYVLHIIEQYVQQYY
jgi:hypothetical protein